MLFSAVQPLNAVELRVVRLAGRFTVVSAVQSENALPSMLVTPSRTVMVVSAAQLLNVPYAARFPPTETSVSSAHSANSLPSVRFKPSGRLSVLILVFWNALSPTDFRVAGNSRAVRPVESKA